MHLSPLAALLVASLGAPFGVPLGRIAWEDSYGEARDRARAENRVIFVAVNMDGERANERMVNDVYTDGAITALAGHTVNLVASLAGHAKSGKCPRFGCSSCDVHRSVEGELRRDYLTATADGSVIAPQHLFLGPAGEVILSVPWELRVEELEWCFVTALRAVDPGSKVRASANARAPKRAILGGVVDPAEAEAGPTDEEVEETIKELRKGALRGGERNKALQRLLLSDDPDAVEEVQNELRRARGGAAGRGAAGAQRQKAALLHRMGAVAPASYWEVAAEFLSNADENLRAEAIAALEQLAAPEALGDVKKALRRAEEPSEEATLLRALGSVGAADKGARSELLKRVEREKDERVRINSVLALGHLVENDEVTQVLLELLGNENESEDARIAAACAMALTRSPAWKDALTRHATSEGESPFQRACVAAGLSLDAGSLQPIESIFRQVSKDAITRERFFGSTARRAQRERDEGDDGNR